MQNDMPMISRQFSPLLYVEGRDLQCLCEYCTCHPLPESL